MKTKIDENDSRLAAYAFGELSRSEADEVKKLLAGRDDLQKVVDEFVLMGVMLSDGFGSDAGMKLSPEQRAAVHLSGSRPTAENVVSMNESAWKRTAVVLLGSAAVIAVCFIVLNQIETEGGGEIVEKRVDRVSTEDLAARVGVEEAEWDEGDGGGVERPESGDAAIMASGVELHTDESRDEIKRRLKEGISLPQVNHVVEGEREWQLVAEQASTRLPLVSGSASWGWVEQSVMDGGLPMKSMVRVEELVNYFKYSLSDGIPFVEGIDIGVKVVPCPWNMEHFLALVNVKNTSKVEHRVEVGMTLLEGIKGYRLVGYGGDSGSLLSVGNLKMQSGYGHLVMYELDVFEKVERGELLVHVSSDDEMKSFGVSFLEEELIEMEEDVRMALLVATWGEWLKSGDGGLKERVIEMFSELDEEKGLNDNWLKGLQVIKASLKL